MSVLSEQNRALIERAEIGYGGRHGNTAITIERSELNRLLDAARAEGAGLLEDGKVRGEQAAAVRTPSPTPFTPPGAVEQIEDYAPMTSKSISCTKCLGVASPLSAFCTHKVCPAREFFK